MPLGCIAGNIAALQRGSNWTYLDAKLDLWHARVCALRSLDVRFRTPTPTLLHTPTPSLLLVILIHKRALDHVPSANRRQQLRRLSV